MLTEVAFDPVCVKTDAPSRWRCGVLPPRRGGGCCLPPLVGVARRLFVRTEVVLAVAYGEVPLDRCGAVGGSAEESGVRRRRSRSGNKAEFTEAECGRGRLLLVRAEPVRPWPIGVAAARPESGVEADCDRGTVPGGAAPEPRITGTRLGVRFGVRDDEPRRSFPLLPSVPPTGARGGRLRCEAEATECTGCSSAEPFRCRCRLLCAAGGSLDGGREPRLREPDRDPSREEKEDVE